MSSDSSLSVRRLAASRLDVVDVLRGFACLWVTYCHAHASWGRLAGATGPLRLLTYFVGIGGKGVDLFVVVSGFCLFFPVLKRARANQTQHTIGQFYARRANRIGPVYFSAIVFALAVLGLGYRTAEYRGLGDLWPSLLFVQNNMPDHVARINGTLWSVALEAQLYLLFPLFAWAFLRGRGGVLVGAAAVLSVLASVGHAKGVFAGHVFDFADDTALPARGVQFVLGMAAAAVCVDGRRSWRATLYAAAPVALLVAVASITRAGQVSVIRHLTLPAWGVVGAAALVALIHFDHVYGRVPAVLVPLQRMGLISFSVYVVHFPVLLALEPLVAPHVRGPVQAIGLFTVTGLPLILTLGLLMFRFVERHTLNAGKPAAGPARRPPGTFPHAEPPVLSDTALIAEAAV